MKEFEGMGRGDNACWITDRDPVGSPRAFRVAGERLQLRLKVVVNSKRSTLLLTFSLSQQLFFPPLSKTPSLENHKQHNTTVQFPPATLHKLYDSHP